MSRKSKPIADSFTFFIGCEPYAPLLVSGSYARFGAWKLLIRHDTRHVLCVREWARGAWVVDRRGSTAVVVDPTAPASSLNALEKNIIRGINGRRAAQELCNLLDCYMFQRLSPDGLQVVLAGLADLERREGWDMAMHAVRRRHHKAAQELKQIQEGCLSYDPDAKTRDEYQDEYQEET